jgi:uncharacterized protein YndB with AHSA1/START domain
MKFATIKQTELIDGSPEEVFDAYVKPENHAEFTGSPATGSPKVGGKFTAWDRYISGKYIELVKGKKIVYEWVTTEWPAGNPPSIVEVTLRPRVKKTELTMVQTRTPAEQAEDYRQGWIDSYWEPMKKYFVKK